MARSRPPYETEIAGPFVLWTSGIYNMQSSAWQWLSMEGIVPVNWTMSNHQAPEPLVDGSHCLSVMPTTNGTGLDFDASPCNQGKYFVCEKKASQFFTKDTAFQCECPGVRQHGSHCEDPSRGETELTVSTGDKEIHLSCPPGTALSVEYVFYGYSVGRTFENVANDDSECFIDTALYYVKLWCNGRAECKFMLDDEIPNPCFPLKRKNVEIRWSCRPQNQTAMTMTSSTMSSGQSMTVSTPNIVSSIEPTVEGITASTVEPTVENMAPSTDPTVENMTASTTEPTVENTTASTIELAVENITMSTIEPTVENITVPTIDISVSTMEIILPSDSVPVITESASTPSDTTTTLSLLMTEGPVDVIYCNMTEVMGLLWPRWQGGQVITMPCPKGKMGEAVWYCDDRGHYVPEGEPDMTRCMGQWTEALMMQISTDVFDPWEVLEDLRKLLEKEFFAAGDIMFAVAVVEKCNEKSLLASKESTFVEKMETIEANLNISNSLLGPNCLAQWKGIPTINRTKCAVQLMENLEKAIGLFQYVYLNKFFSNSPQIVLDAMELPMEHPEMVTARFPSRHSDFINGVAAELNITGVVDYTTVNGGNQEIDLIEITEKPSRVVTNSSRMHRPRVVFILYNNIQSLITDDTKGNTSIISNSPVLTATLAHNGIIGNSYRKQIHYTMRWNKVEWKENGSGCVFWENRTESGVWSGEGCALVSTNSTHATCTCDHLTNFAILMDVYGSAEEISPPDRLALDIVTYLGCIVSIICLTMAIIVFSIFRELWCPRNTIHRNLCINLCLGEILFIAGVERTENRVVCGIIAGSLHYCFLAAFAWMCLEGIEIYQMVVRVIRSRETNVLWYYLAGYGIPLMLVAISASVLPQGYGTETRCWLSTERGLIWAFAGPVAVITMANMVVLGICIRVLYNNGKRTNKHGETVVKKLGVAVRGALVLLCLLGLTWVVGFVYLGRSTIVFAYIFSILNSAQGLFIFVFQCATNDKVLQQIRRWARRSELCRQFIRKKLSNTAPTSSLARARNSNPSVAGRHLTHSSDQNIESTRQVIVPGIGRESRRFSDVPLETTDSELSEKSSGLENENKRRSVSAISAISMISVGTCNDSSPFYISRVGTDDIYVEI
ncbi:adhesion G protein-coupled receptor L3-like [Lineus longissimus]|uniref:adhesion G protein-coupled receptor L3-like n=1 Tax=Lineus longissimus TaxID=88925 RepID=UPI00315CCF20